MKSLLLLLLIFITPTAIANPIHKQSVYFTHGRIEYLNAYEPNASDKVQYFSDSDNDKPTFEYSIALDGNMLKAAKFENHLTVLLEYSGSTHNVIVLDSENGKVIDNFWCARSSISPNGRFIIFNPWYGRGIRANTLLPVGETRIYDVTKSPMENRNKSGQAELRNNPISISKASKNTGVTIYPFGNFSAPDYGFVDKKEKSVGAYSGYYWYNEQSFIFNTPPYHNKTMLVDASFNEKKKTFVVKTKWLTTKDLSVNNPSDNPDLNVNKIEKFGNTIKLYLPRSIVFLRDFAN